MESHKKLDIILEATPVDRRDKIKTMFNEKGMVETVIYLAEEIWDSDTKKLAEEATKTGNKESKYYKVLFDVYDMKAHFSQVDSHRKFIKLAYERLKDFVPNMTAHLAEIHDLSKYDFSQSLGYTARWVHNVANGHGCWQRGLNDHYNREPHHPQYYKPEEQMERKYLEESLIDMVASRWERQLKGEMGVSNFQLVDFMPVFLERYVKDDFKEIQILIEKIKNSENRSRGNPQETKKS